MVHFTPPNMHHFGTLKWCILLLHNYTARKQASKDFKNPGRRLFTPARIRIANFLIKPASK
ncbi:MAG: hypothetical protein LKG50_04765, partial [Prevotella sp.]